MEPLLTLLALGLLVLSEFSRVKNKCLVALRMR